MFGSAFSFNQPHTSAFSSSNPFVHDSRVSMAENGGAFTNVNVDEGVYSKVCMQYMILIEKNIFSHSPFIPQGTRPKPTNLRWPDAPIASNESHEYHEISDDETAGDKVFDLGPSLLDEMDFMFRSLKAAPNGAVASSTHADPSDAHHHQNAHQPPVPPATHHGNLPAPPSATEPTSPDFIDTHNKNNEIAELTSKLQHSRRQLAAGVSSTLGGKSKKKGAGTVKPISVKDERILNQAIDYANEISAR